jgi:hypothetical protein
MKHMGGCGKKAENGRNKVVGGIPGAVPEMEEGDCGDQKREKRMIGER